MLHFLDNYADDDDNNSDDNDDDDRGIKMMMIKIL